MWAILGGLGCVPPPVASTPPTHPAAPVTTPTTVPSTPTMGDTGPTTSYVGRSCEADSATGSCGEVGVLDASWRIEAH